MTRDPQRSDPYKHTSIINTATMPTVAELLGDNSLLPLNGSSESTSQNAHGIKKAKKEKISKKKQKKRRKVKVSISTKKETASTRKVRCPHCNRLLEEYRLSHHLKTLPCSLQENSDTEASASHKRRIVLYSKRGTRYLVERICANCGLVAKTVWRYARSNIGEVFLCPRCKNQIYDQSHYKVDAWAVVVDRPKPQTENVEQEERID